MLRKLAVLIISLLTVLKMSESLLKVNIGSSILLFGFLRTETEVCPLVCLFPGLIPSVKILEEPKLVPRHAPCTRECSLEGMPALYWEGEGEWGLPYPLAPSWMISLFLEKQREVNWLELPSNWPFYYAGLFYVIIHSSHPFLFFLFSFYATKLYLHSSSEYISVVHPLF